ncbi:ADP-ribosylation factor 4-like [Homarus americanus]|uniref:ADP-ribosylation factor 4-like n=1 Tax=Homarus americanus TaxID=6706 RepID=A0A8J5JCC4_HOMAM|nr:ADP-ribosylation factor 4-like [Homarus americanus]
MIGLHGSGITTVLHNLQLGEVLTLTPTVGFDVEVVEYDKFSFLSWYIGTPSKMMPLWRHYYPEAVGIIFVIDSNDPKGLVESRSRLKELLKCDELAGHPLLVLANKQDLPQAASVEKVTDILQLRHLDRLWFVQPTCAIKPFGIQEGLDWLLNHVPK